MIELKLTPKLPEKVCVVCFLIFVPKFTDQDICHDCVIDQDFIREVQ